MPAIKTNYDVAIIGGGHIGLVAACYLAMAGLSVLVLERNKKIGGATGSKRIFDGVDARLSVYSYLVSLFPQKIINDLNLQLRSRKTASWAPTIKNGKLRELLIRNDHPGGNRKAFLEFTGNEHDYRGYLDLQDMQKQLASVIWPSLTAPLVTREDMHSRMNGEGKKSGRP